MKEKYAVVRRLEQKDGICTYNFISEPDTFEKTQHIANDLNKWSAGTARGAESYIKSISYHIVLGIT